MGEFAGRSGARSALPGSRGAVAGALRPGLHGLPPEVVAENQRRRLVDAFVRKVAADGYARTTIAGVAAAAGVSKKTFYVHFDSLEECFLSTYADGSGLVLTRMEAAYRSCEGWRDSIRAALRALLETLAEEPEFARFSVVEAAAAAGPRIGQARQRTITDFQNLFTAPGAPCAPPLVRNAIAGGIHSLISLHVETGRTAELPDLLPTLTYFYLLPLVGKEEASTELACA